MNHPFRLHPSLFFAMLLACQTPLQAVTSYLLFQGAFGSGGATVTDKWAVTYTPGATGAPVTGQDLLNDVFGTPTGSGSILTAGNATQGATYLNTGYGLELTSVTLGGVTLAQNVSSSLGWNYYNAGGSYYDYYGDLQSYPNSTWTYANTGAQGFYVASNSYDGWVFGSTGTYGGPPDYDQLTPPASIVGADPVPLNFSGSTTQVSSINGVSVYSYQAAPEPGRAALLVASLGVLLMRRRRPSRS